MLARRHDVDERPALRLREFLRARGEHAEERDRRRRHVEDERLLARRDREAHRVGAEDGPRARRVRSAWHAGGATRPASGS